MDRGGGLLSDFKNGMLHVLIWGLKFGAGKIMFEI